MQIDLGQFADLILKSVPLRNARDSRYMRAKRFIITKAYLERVVGKVLSKEDRRVWSLQIPEDCTLLDTWVSREGDLWFVLEHPEWQPYATQQWRTFR